MTLAESRRLRRYERLLHAVGALEPSVRRLSDRDLRAAVGSIRDRRRRGATQHELIPELFALVREAARRAIGLRHFDVQILAGLALQDRQVIEMDTGEGKTLVATLIAVLHALDHKGVHIVTVNDYLAARDTEWMRPVYELLGFSVGAVLCDHTYAQRAQAYRADVTYGTIRQLGYDFLSEWFGTDPATLQRLDPFSYMRGTAMHSREDVCLRGRHFVLLDEADSVLIDFARAPLTLTEPARDTLDPRVYAVARATALQLVPDRHYTLDHKRRHVEITPEGEKVAQELAEQNPRLGLLAKSWERRLTDAIRGEHLMINGRDYVVQDGEVKLIDDITGRILRGQRLGGEVHQALEAKEGVPIQPRQVVARQITIQTLVRGYKNSAGMTGTAWQARHELHRVYRLGVTRFETNRPCLRVRSPDRVYPDADQRTEALIEDIALKNSQGRPVLVGTRSVRTSEDISQRLHDRGIDHSVLNATQHAEEAQVIARAGQRGAVTVATNMAGRGVDIVLGPGVADLGGLYVVGAERHEVTRFDNQLGGRCARQGDPGSVQYYASLDDDIFRVLGDKRLRRLKRRHAGRKGARDSVRLARIVDRLQDRIERYFADLRAALLKHDEFLEMRDEFLYSQRSI